MWTPWVLLLHIHLSIDHLMDTLVNISSTPLLSPLDKIGWTWSLKTCFYFVCLLKRLVARESELKVDLSWSHSSSSFGWNGFGPLGLGSISFVRDEHIVSLSWWWTCFVLLDLSMILSPFLGEIDSLSSLELSLFRLMMGLAFFLSWFVKGLVLFPWTSFGVRKLFLARFSKGFVGVSWSF